VVEGREGQNIAIKDYLLGANYVLNNTKNHETMFDVKKSRQKRQFDAKLDF